MASWVRLAAHFEFHLKTNDQDAHESCLDAFFFETAAAAALTAA